MNYDLVVVGAGMAGLTAAAKAREEGLKVLVLAQGQGTLNLGSGTIDLLGKANIKEFLEVNEEHPYKKVGLKDTLESLKYFQQISHSMGYPYTTLDNTSLENTTLEKADAGHLKNFYLPTALGTVKPTYLAPLTMIKGDLRQEGDILIVGFQELKDFSPSLVAKNLTEVRERHGIKGCCEEVMINLELSKRSVNAFDLATLMDKRDIRIQILTKIKAAIEARVSHQSRTNTNNELQKVRVGIPAILGTQPSIEIFQEFEKELQVGVFEIPTLQPSVGGIRLNTMLVNYLKKLGTKVLYASPVKGVACEGGLIKAVLVESAGGRATSYNTKHLILATGGVYGGGLKSTRDGFEEKIANLPLDISPNTVRDVSSTKFVSSKSPNYAQVGVKVNQRLMPLGDDGVSYTNLYVIGRSLAKFDPAVEKSGHGVAIATACKAIKEITNPNLKGGE